ncbi:hypothetical protein [Spirochaeta isovalerica]|uniref:Uncharacterized protein n=1 Tax=Spirochaeta isovalerica TaxID=150 RepID=A0A841RI93_9SPIO|nr:hypothetical protein [Spirochaeta isovalerica]MBB6482720.1 hypothetical protein [Spirochaeta isovalerica]
MDILAFGYVILFYGLIISHIVYAIITTLKLMKRTEIENYYLAMIVIWIVPIFGSKSVRIKENI